jgi:hypothetical protein
MRLKPARLRVGPSFRVRLRFGGLLGAGASDRAPLEVPVRLKLRSHFSGIIWLPCSYRLCVYDQVAFTAALALAEPEMGALDWQAAGPGFVWTGEANPGTVAGPPAMPMAAACWYLAASTAPPPPGRHQFHWATDARELALPLRPAPPRRRRPRRH